MKIKVTNIVGVFDIEKELNLNKVVEVLDDAIYDPDQFPGVIYKTKTLVPKLLIFRTGRCVVAGARTLEELRETAYIMEKKFNDNPQVFLNGAHTA